MERDGDVRATEQELRAFCLSIFGRLGVSDEDSAIWTDVLIETSLRGVDSHGILVLPLYVAMVEAGGIELNVRLETVADHGSTALFDGRGGSGQVIADCAMNRAIERADRFGISFVAVRNSNHCGMAAYYAMKCLARDMIGMAFTNSGPQLPAWGGKTKVIGSNAMAVAVPAGKEAAIVFDAAVGASAAAKVFLAAERGERIPFDWIVDRDGQPTDDPHALFQGGAILPFGKHKGYGIGVILDVLTGVLSGGAFSKSVGTIGQNMSEPLGVCHSFAALDISRFISVDRFKSRMDEMIRNIKKSETVEGADRVYLPGERGFRTYQYRKQHGIPLHAKLVADLERLAQRFSVPAPATL